MQILGLLVMYFHAVVVKVKTFLLLFRLALAILCLLMACAQLCFVCHRQTHCHIFPKMTGGGVSYVEDTLTDLKHNLFMFSSKHWGYQGLLGMQIGIKSLYSRVRNKRTPTFIIFWIFFQGLCSYYGLKRLEFYYISLHILRACVYFSCRIFQKLRLFKQLHLFWTLEQQKYALDVA